MVTFWKNDQQLCWLSGRMTSSFVDCVLWEISRHLLCRYLAERDWSYLHHQRWQRPCTPSTENLGCEQQNKTHLVWLIFEVSIPTCICFPSENFLWHVGTHLMMDLNQKLIKSMPREDTCCSMFTIRQKCLCKKLGVKKWEGICLKGTYFQGFTVSMYQLTNFLWHKLWRFVSRSYITRADIALSAKFESF